MSLTLAPTQKSQSQESPLKKMKHLHSSSVSLSSSTMGISRTAKLQNSVASLSLSQVGKHSPLPMHHESQQKPYQPIIQPSRFGLKDKLKPIEYCAQKVLTDLETQVEGMDTVFKKNDPNNKAQQEKISLYMQSIEPMAHRIKKPTDFKVKPLRRVESDLQMFNDIFIQPQQTRLLQLNTPNPNQSTSEDQFLDSAERFFQSSKNEALLLQSTNKKHTSTQETLSNKQNPSLFDRKTPIKFNQSEVFTLLNNSITVATLKEDLLIKQGNASPNRRRNDSSSLAFSQTPNLNSSGTQALAQNINNLSLLEQSIVAHKEPTKQFFDQLIQVQPPDLPNATSASPIAPGVGYAPSVPLVTNFDEAGKSLVKDLLVRAKAGQQAGDVQKEAHLSFYLGMVYDNQKKYSQAIKHYLKYYTCARLMGDKIGMGLGANRVGCDYFHTGDYEKSIEFHEKNISYSDSENVYAGYYNLGIALRRNSRKKDAINSFQTCLSWARERGEMESECLSLGQLGITYSEVNEDDQALFHFTDCYELSKKLRKVKLQLDCLIQITKLLSKTAMKNSDNSIRVLRDAIDCARVLDDKKTASLCLCNLGIMEGSKSYEGLIEGQQFENAIEDWGDEDEDYLLARRNQNTSQSQTGLEIQEQLQKNDEQGSEQSNRVEEAAILTHSE